MSALPDANRSGGTFSVPAPLSGSRGQQRRESSVTRQARATSARVWRLGPRGDGDHLTPSATSTGSGPSWASVMCSPRTLARLRRGALPRAARDMDRASRRAQRVCGDRPSLPSTSADAVGARSAPAWGHGLTVRRAECDDPARVTPLRGKSRSPMSSRTTFTATREPLGKPGARFIRRPSCRSFGHRVAIRAERGPSQAPYAIAFYARRESAWGRRAGSAL